ncbi:hypothetical protein D3C71_1544050 [compost metagenome]
MAAGAHRIALGWRDQFKPRGRRHFNHRGAVFQQTPDGVDLVAQRIVHRKLPRCAAGCGQHGLNRAFATVGHGNADSVGAGAGGFHAARNGRRRVRRGNAFFERVGSNDDFHGVGEAGYGSEC